MEPHRPLHVRLRRRRPQSPHVNSPLPTHPPLAHPLTYLTRTSDGPSSSRNPPDGESAPMAPHAHNPPPTPKITSPPPLLPFPPQQSPRKSVAFRRTQSAKSLSFRCPPVGTLYSCPEHTDRRKIPDRNASFSMLFCMARLRACGAAGQ